MLAVVVGVALVFAFTNGFHDAANAVATSVTTRALTPRIALLLAAVMNFVGSLLGQGVARTVSRTVGHLDAADGLVVLLSALLGAITWNLATWWRGLPSSSSQALVGGLLGAALAGGVTVHWRVVLGRVVLPMLVSPLVGAALAAGIMLTLLWALRGGRPGPVNRGLRMLQTLSAAAVALGHGLQDAQKTMGVILLALVAAGHASRAEDLPRWVVLAAATALSLGTWSGGWRIIRTLARRLVPVDAATGFAAEAATAAILYATAFLVQVPVSTTQAASSAIVGAGAARRTSAVRWVAVRRIVTAWALTLPASALVAALVYLVAHHVLRLG